MKKVFAVLLALLIVFCFAACKNEDGQPTRSQEELIAEADDAAEKLVDYKETLDTQLTLVNSADNNEKFFDLAGMAAAGAQFDAVFELIDFGSAELTDGDASPVKNAATAKQAAEQIAEIAEKINTAAVKYYKQFIAAYPEAAMTKMYGITVFMSGEPSSFFAADYTDAEGNAKTVYSVSSFTAGTPEDVLASISANLFAENPVSSRNAVKDGNFNIDLDAVKAAATPAEEETESTTEEVTEAETETEAATQLVTEAETAT